MVVVRDDCAVLEAARIPKYAVVMVPTAVNADVSTDTIAALEAVVFRITHTARTDAATMPMSPETTTHKPVQARVCSTPASADVRRRRRDVAGLDGAGVGDAGSDCDCVIGSPRIGTQRTPSRK